MSHTMQYLLLITAAMQTPLVALGAAYGYYSSCMNYAVPDVRE